MKMEISYRDKMVLLVISVIVILVGGFFALIKPKYDAYQKDLKTYETTKTKWDAIDREIQQIEPLKESITKTYGEAKSTAAIFINSAFTTANKNYRNEKTNYELDQYLQAAIDESNLKVNDMTLDDVSSEEIEYYYYEPDVLTYSLLEAADVNGDYAAEIGEDLLESMVLSERETAELMTSDITLNVQGTKENLMTFLDKIDSDKNAVLINDVSIDDYQFLGGLEELEGSDGQTYVIVDEETVGTSVMDITLRFYNAKNIDEPNLGE